MLKMGDFGENKITMIVGLNKEENALFLNEFIKENNLLNVKFSTRSKVKKVLKNNYNHEYVKLLNIDTSKRIRELSRKEEDLVAFLVGIFNDNIIALDESVIDEKVIEIIKKSNKTAVIFFSNLDDIEIADSVYLLKDSKLFEYKPIKSKYVRITGEGISKSTFPLKNMKIDYFNSKEIEFVYSGDINELLPYLVEIKITNLEIRDLKLAEIYKYYYKK